MKSLNLHKSLTLLISLVWLANGLFCKVMNLVPRHELIVGRILGVQNPRPFAIAIGIAETCMAIWILSGFRSRLNAIIQMVIVAVMNILEFFLAPDLLLWGKANAIFAAIFILIIYTNEFIIKRRSLQQA
jgi:uncharacterized membrane protein YphA (DoxX/SURF4 family)